MGPRREVKCTGAGDGARLMVMLQLPAVPVAKLR